MLCFHFIRKINLFSDEAKAKSQLSVIDFQNS